MEAYPSEYVEHNLPLILISGLGEEQTTGDGSPALTRQDGSRISINAPECRHEKAQALRAQFQRYDGRENAWNGTALPGPAGSLKYLIKHVGRKYTLPPRKAAPQSQSVEEGVGSPLVVHKSPELHSPLSPLSPSSPLFPDIVFTPQWHAKHQQQVPALMIACFDIRAQGAAEDDELIKVNLNDVRNSLSRSGYKTKFAAVLLSDSGILHAPQLEERLSAIRRATALDPKTGLFFMPPMSSQAEIATFVQSIMTTLQPGVVEYYRDLTKHARRKKTKGPSTSPSVGTSQSLSTASWNARYEVKQGVFAEFRQEMDVAERHYSLAIDDLFNEEGIFETTASWSPKWNQARLLCDTLAVRVIRCQLWMGEPTGSVQSWVNYRLRMKDLIDRRGKGSQTYGWEAWEARWARIMAQLITRAELPAFTTLAKQALDDSEEIQKQLVFAMPEKNAANAQRLAPFEMLHHPGYWHRLSALRSMARLSKAKDIPEEDRTPPTEVSASAVAKRARTYDIYLVPEPHLESPMPGKEGYDHLADIAASFNNAVDELHGRGQLRLAESCRLDLALAYAEDGQIDQALPILTSLWQETYWRSEDWNDCFNTLLERLWLLTDGRPELAETRLAVAWELLSVPAPAGAPNRPIDLGHCLDDSQTKEVVSLQMQDSDRASPIALRFAFEDKQGYVGEPMECQLFVASNAWSGSAPIGLEYVSLQFGTQHKVILSNASAERAEATDEADFVHLELENHDDGSSLGKADLTLKSGRSRTYAFRLTFKEAHTLQLQQAAVAIENEKFRLSYTFTSSSRLYTTFWICTENGKQRARRLLAQGETTSVQVLPKPPKLQLLVHGLRKQYYIGERIELKVEVINHEEDVVDARLRAWSSDEDAAALKLGWDGSNMDDDSQDSIVIEQKVPELPSVESFATTLWMDSPALPSKAKLGVDAQYTLRSDSGVPLTKSTTMDLVFAQAFEAKFKFGPLLEQAGWPSFFDAESANPQKLGGIQQRWQLNSEIVSAAAETLHIRKATVRVDSANGNIVCDAIEHDQKEFAVLPKQAFTKAFELSTQKQSLDDRRPAELELSVLISWSRNEGSRIFTTAIKVTRCHVPVSEPRVLCTVADRTDNIHDIVLQYHLENPSMHFLTFALTMEASEDFAFSGTKLRTLSLAPMSRHHVEYGVILYDDGDDKEGDEGRFIWPSLQVADSFYQRQLRVQAAGPGVHFDDDKGIGVWIANKTS